MIRATLSFLSLLVMAWALPAAGQETGPEAEASSAADEPSPRVEAHLSPAGAAYVAGMNAFAVDLYKARAAGSANLLVSPASVSTAIALAYRGAKGATAAEMRAVMHYPLPPETSAVAGGEVLATMAIKAPGRDLATANSLWVQAGLPLNRDFLADLDRHYGAALHPVDFERNDQTARLLINSWVEGKTGNRIKELLHPEDVSAGTKSVLVNAIYLKAQWATPFKIGATRAGPFRTLDGRTLPVPLMNLRSSFKVAARGGVQAIALPYRSGELEMVVLLPKSIGGLPRFERTLTAQGLAAWLKRLDEAEPADTILTLPRFRLEWRDDLVPTLVGLGMRVPMSDAGDFSGSKFVDPASSDPNDLAIKIGRVIHQTFLDVDENGSEAAAATAVVNIVVSGKRIAPPPPPPIIFRADRPFLFLIRDARTGAILFMGRMVAPPSDPPARAGGDG